MIEIKFVFRGHDGLSIFDIEFEPDTEGEILYPELKLIIKESNVNYTKSITVPNYLYKIDLSIPDNQDIFENYLVGLINDKFSTNLIDSSLNLEKNIRTYHTGNYKEYNLTIDKDTITLYKINNLDEIMIEISNTNHDDELEVIKKLEKLGF